jgi:RNA polymerase sigma-70 factor (ECF subfamily)
MNVSEDEHDVGSGDPSRGPGPLGLEAQLRRILLEHADFVWRVLRRLGVPSAHVEDATQQVFLVVAEKLRAHEILHERAYLYRTAANVALHVRRGEGRRREVFGEELNHIEHGGSSPDELLDLHRARGLLDVVLEAMSEELREVFVLFELEELSMAEIAIVLGIPSGTVASRLRRAREAFRTSLQRAHPRGSRARDGASRSGA